MPVCSVHQGAVVAEKNHSLSAEVGSQLNGTLPGIERTAIRWGEKLNAEPGMSSFALGPAFGAGFQRVVVMIPPGEIGSENVLAVWHCPPARINRNERVTGAGGQCAVVRRQRRAAGDADKGFGHWGSLEGFALSQALRECLL